MVTFAAHPVLYPDVCKPTHISFYRFYQFFTFTQTLPILWISFFSAIHYGIVLFFSQKLHPDLIMIYGLADCYSLF